MLSRNRELRRAVLAWLALGIAATAAAWTLGGTPAAVAAGTGALVATLPFLVLTHSRYRRLAQIANRIDAVLHGQRELALDRMDEGELAILANELDKMVTRLNLTADELARERQNLADALADISHQLKTPLTSLSIATELVRARLSERGDCADEVTRLRTVERLEMQVEQLVTSLLKLARLDAGKLKLERAPVDVSDLARRAFEPLAIAYDIADVHFRCDVEDGCGYVGDVAWSAEAVSNILKNCMEHTPAGGTVTLRAHQDALACRVQIEDTGPGIAPEDLPHVFERFWRGSKGEEEASSAVNPAGVGIGLSLARSLVAAQGGTLRAGNAVAPDGSVTGARFDIAFFKDVAI